MDAAVIHRSARAQGDMCSFGLHILHQKLFPALWEAAGRKGTRTSPHELSLAMEGPDGPPHCYWEKSAASVGISPFLNEVRQD